MLRNVRFPPTFSLSGPDARQLKADSSYRPRSNFRPRREATCTSVCLPPRTRRSQAIGLDDLAEKPTGGFRESTFDVGTTGPGREADIIEVEPFGGTSACSRSGGNGFPVAVVDRRSLRDFGLKEYRSYDEQFPNRLRRRIGWLARRIHAATKKSARRHGRGCCHRKSRANRGDQVARYSSTIYANAG